MLAVVLVVVDRPANCESDGGGRVNCGGGPATWVSVVMKVAVGVGVAPACGGGGGAPVPLLLT